MMAPLAERVRRLARRRTLAGNPASAVYGTVLVAGQLAVESGTGHSSGAMIASLAATLIVFWLVHAYTDTLGSAVEAAGPQPPHLKSALRTEWPIVESGALPVVGLLVALAFGAQPGDAALAALIVADVELFGWGLLAARRHGLGGWRRVGYAAVVTALGVVLIGLKYAIH